MDSQTEYTIEATLERAKEIAQEQMPSWEGGFACMVIESIEALKKDNARMTRAEHNNSAIDDEIIWCDCNATHDEYEIGGTCSCCGGAVEGIVMLAGS